MFFPSKADTDLTAVTLFIRPTQNFLFNTVGKALKQKPFTSNLICHTYVDSK